MKLASVAVAGRQTVAAQTPDGASVDAAQLLGRPDLDMHALMSEPDLIGSLSGVLAQPSADDARLDPEAMRWLAPSPRPSKIVGVAINNRFLGALAHRPATEPAYFLKPPSALIGHRETIVVPPEYGLTHPEPELAAVIGRRASDLIPEIALEAVFGFTIINDITSPGLKDRDSMELDPGISVGPDPEWRRIRGGNDHSLYLTYHARSKGCDTFAPMGPWLTTTSDIPDANSLDVKGWLGDQLVLSDSTASLTFTIEEVLAHLSTYMTLERGDIVHFGTAARPAAPERFPSMRSIDISRLDEPLAVEIDQIGRLENPVSRSRAPRSSRAGQPSGAAG